MGPPLIYIILIIRKQPMLKKLLFILLIVAVPLTSFAQQSNRKFYDYLAAQHKDFRTAKATQYIDGSDNGGGNLDFYFGADISRVTSLLNSGKFNFWRVHFLNGPGVNNGNTASYEITKGWSKAQLDSKIKNKDSTLKKYFFARVKLYCELIPKYPNIEFAFSPLLEGRVSAQSWEILNQWTVDACDKKFILINSPLEGKNLTHGAKLESHGHRPDSAAYITSLDGIDATDINIKEWWERTSKNRWTGIWGRSFNCRHQGSWEAGRSRTACPKDQQFEEYAHIVDERPQAPKLSYSQCKTTSAFKAPAIWKPESEDKGTDDKRKNRPVAIVKVSGARGGSLSVITYKGQEIGKLGYYGTFDSAGYHRWYSNFSPGTGQYGYRFEKAAKEKSGYPHVWLKKGNTCIGPVIAGQRNGLPYIK